MHPGNIVRITCGEMQDCYAVIVDMMKDGRIFVEGYDNRYGNTVFFRKFYYQDELVVVE